MPNLGQQMRIVGLRKENERAWAEVDRLRVALKAVLDQDQKLDHLDKPQDGHFARIARRALAGRTENEQPQEITRPDRTLSA